MSEVFNHIPQESNAQLQARLDERTRIARDLHDTLLQRFHGLLMLFHAAHNLLPGRAVDAMHILENALDGAHQAVTEARDAVQGLRSSSFVKTDLATDLNILGGELARCQGAEDGHETAFSVGVVGSRHNLNPILQHEVFRIAGEALSNAFHHSRAQRIEVQIRYDSRQLRVRVQDDGIGIDAGVLSQGGRTEHWGLRGMRERAQGIGGRLEIWSKSGAGTGVELTVASTAHGVHVTAEKISGALLPQVTERRQMVNKKAAGR